MPSKLQFYSEFAERTARQITGSYRSWTAFLATAARLYKHPYNEQLMIYAQRPNATACAEYDFWKDRMGRYVQRGSTGIALIDTSGYQPRLRYVFDVADTAPRDAARSFTLWEMRAEHEAKVCSMLTEQYDVPQDGGIIAQFERVAGQTGAGILDRAETRHLRHRCRFVSEPGMMKITYGWRSKRRHPPASPTRLWHAAAFPRTDILNRKILCQSLTSTHRPRSASSEQPSARSASAF